MSKEQPEALPVRLAKRLCDGISTGHDWPNTDDELLRMQSAAELRRLHAENEALRAQIGQSVPEGWRIEVSNGDIRLYGPRNTWPGMSETWLIQSGHDGFYGFLYRFFIAMLASTHPAPQQKPLTDEQIEAIFAAIPVDKYDGVLSVARAIEAAHGIKGGQQ